MTLAGIMLLVVVLTFALVLGIFFFLSRQKGEINHMNNSCPGACQTQDVESRPKQEPVEERPTQFPPARGIDRQYQNTHVNMRDRHPVLSYQMAHNQGIVPASIGDPIRIPDVAGPMGLYTDRDRFYNSRVIRPDARPYNLDAPGPYPGLPIGVPVPAGALKATEGLYPYPYTPGYGARRGIGEDFPYQQRPVTSGDFFRPLGPNAPSAFVGSVDAYAPFPEVNTPWEKAGILTATHSHSHGHSQKNEILNLYRRPIAPMQDLWEYQVQDKDGYVIKLDRVKYLEDGDLIHDIIGKQGLGPWRAHVFVNNKYVWV